MLAHKVGSCLNKEQQKRNIFWPYKNFQYKKGDWSRFLNVSDFETCMQPELGSLNFVYSFHRNSNTMQAGRKSIMFIRNSLWVEEHWLKRKV